MAFPFETPAVYNILLQSLFRKQNQTLPINYYKLTIAAANYFSF